MPYGFEGKIRWEIRGHTLPYVSDLKAAKCQWRPKELCWVFIGDELPLEVQDILTELHRLSGSHYGPEKARELRGRIERRLIECE